MNREGKYGEAFEENLLYKQSVPGLLSFYEVQEEGEAVLVYGLNHKKSCLEVLEGKRMDCEWMADFIRSLVRVLETVDEYLLDLSDLVIEMAYIFEGDGPVSYTHLDTSLLTRRPHLLSSRYSVCALPGTAPPRLPGC